MPKPTFFIGPGLVLIVMAAAFLIAHRHPYKTNGWQVIRPGNQGTVLQDAGLIHGSSFDGFRWATVVDCDDALLFSSTPLQDKVPDCVSQSH